MNSLWALASRMRNGVPLRHQPIAMTECGPRPVRLELVGRGGSVDVSHLHVPVSLQPLIIGVLDDGSWPAAIGRIDRLVMREPGRNSRQVGSMDLVSHGTSTLAGDVTLQLFRPKRGRTECASHASKTYHYLLAWRHAQRTRHRLHNLQMSAADLRCLDVYYLWARLVFLVSVEHSPGFNVFPMDLVGFVGPQRAFIGALRSTSPSVREIVHRKQITLSSLPAAFKDDLYALGAHHVKPLVDPKMLPFALDTSKVFGLPVPAPAFRVRELVVRGAWELGSHTVFTAETVSDVQRGGGGSDRRQLAHVSAFYARYRRQIGEPLAEVWPS